MMAQDGRGNEVSSGSESTLAGVSDFVEGFLGYETRALNVLAAAEADPEAALAQVYAGILNMFACVPGCDADARYWLDRARNAEANANARERMNIAMLEAWVEGDVPKALAIGDEIIEAYPRDLAALKLHQTLNFGRGDAPAMLRVARKALPANPDDPHLLGMLAFGYEECHFLDRAESAARQALELTEREPWAQHAIAHVMLTEGRVKEGAAFLEAASAGWEGLNSFMYTHNWWHRALFMISLGDKAGVLGAYDRHCWACDQDYAEDQIGAVSLLARMEFAGFDVGDRWSALGERLVPRATDTLAPFMTMQYLYGLAKAERGEADTLMQAVEARAAAAAPFERVAWQHVALPACRGLRAHARGEMEEAVAQLSLAMPRMMEVGGSHAQRDLFAQVLLDAHIKAGNFVTAQQMLESRRRFDPDGVPLNRMLAGVYEKLGLLDEASEARARHYH
ncbi:tetratricopeptide repeat protein [Cucumibacter marinus]|uniref:tetratricopeptide repeat protein n=1 Tax=Cucumibacter marinus TaxID=1121252 RepID=UPI00041E8894|nr:tetratricopeptide repeat protein [Cucumibacter marinus]